MMNKKAFEFNFAWMFAILAGIVIIFLAIYFSSRLIGTETYKLNTVTAKQLSIIFEPMETGMASAKSNLATLKEDTKIFNRCYTEGSFGKNRISLSTKGFGSTWKSAGADIPLTNKYIFSNSTDSGKIFYLFSKPFKMPWKISEVIFITAEKYCFINAPEEIKNEVLGLQLQNVKLENCTNEIKVCFGSGNCQIGVKGTCIDCENEYDSGIVKKQGENLYYTGFTDYSEQTDRSLLYAAIFSNKDIYECNIKRLISRLIQQALIYRDESAFLTGRCGTISDASLIQIISAARNMQDSNDLNYIQQAAKSLDDENNAVQCSLW